jgi:hypothetical protein
VRRNGTTLKLSRGVLLMPRLHALLADSHELRPMLMVANCHAVVCAEHCLEMRCSDTGLKKLARARNQGALQRKGSGCSLGPSGLRHLTIRALPRENCRADPQ